MKKLSVFVSLLFFAALSKAQTDEVYLTSGDTLAGKIDILLPADYYEEIMVKTDNEKRRIKSFRMLGFKAGNDVYKIIKFGDKYRIMEEIISGYLGLYRFRADNNYDFGSRFLYKVTNEGIEVPNITFKKAVADFVSECPSVQTDVKNKTYKASNIEEMIRAFNNCINERPQVTVEVKEEEKPVVKASKELELINTIAKKLESESISEELSTLLSDLEAKISKGENVPGYLTGALEENTKEFKSVSKEVKKLLNLLK
ncbi:MAG: hypothetical protein AAGA02_12560 [Bacteroidota bacterium]